MRHTTCKMGQATAKRQHATRDVRHATENVRYEAKKQRKTRSNGQQCRRRPLENVQQTIDNMQHASGKMHLTTRSEQRTTTRQHVPCSGQYAANNKQHAPRNRQHAQDFKQHAADNNDMQRNMHHAACNGRRGIQKRPLTTANKATRQQGKKATCGMQQTTRGRRQTQATLATGSRRHASGREHMRHARHCRISCAASSGQRTSSSMREALYPTTSAQHGTDDIHKMQHTTVAAACSKHTRNRHHAAGIETYEMR
jgi:hypothetical protein